MGFSRVSSSERRNLRSFRASNGSMEKRAGSAVLVGIARREGLEDCQEKGGRSFRS